MTRNDAERAIYISAVRGQTRNTSYPYKAVIACKEGLAKAAAFDHVCAYYANGKNSRGDTVEAYRSKKTFISAAFCMYDCDNLPDNPLADDLPPDEWKQPADADAAFPNVEHYRVYSRNHMKEKDGKPARPKWHDYYPLRQAITSADRLEAFNQAVRAHFPAYDRQALDAARFVFGVENPVVKHIPGDICLDEFMVRKAEQKKQEQARAQSAVQAPKFTGAIPVGQRNSTLSRFAATVLKKYGNADGKAYSAFIEKANQCEQPLDESELATIWRSAEGNYTRHTIKQPDYIPPTEYAAQGFETSLEPSDYTDVGQATVLADVYGDKLKYSKATKWLVYNGMVWQEDEIKARKLAQDLTEQQLNEARKRVRRAQNDVNRAVEAQDDDQIKQAKQTLNREEAFRSYVLSERKTVKLSAALTETEPKLQIGVDALDADGYLLNTPGGTIDLRTGSVRPHKPDDYCTKITTVAPGIVGAELWRDFLNRLTVGDGDLERYLQEVAGMFSVGKVLREKLIIAYGEGGNGKSTFFNLLARVMGDYAGALSAETLTVNCRKNKSPEYAELRGKRIVIAAELEEGTRLDTSIVKKLCSTDPILAEKKYKDPFTFTPSHTVVLYTNHLPKVGTTDKGTWDRLVTIPFKANFRGMKGEIFNYTDYLFDHAGGAVLAWIVNGARLFIANGYQIEMPACVEGAIDKYRSNNDWLDNFLDEECEIDSRYTQKSGELYARYKAYCDGMGDYRRSLADFKAALMAAGFETRKTCVGAYVYGLRVKSDFAVVDEPTPWDKSLAAEGI